MTFQEEAFRTSGVVMLISEVLRLVDGGWGCSDRSAACFFWNSCRSGSAQASLEGWLMAGSRWLVSQCACLGCPWLCTVDPAVCGCGCCFRQRLPASLASFAVLPVRLRTWSGVGFLPPRGSSLCGRPVGDQFSQPCIHQPTFILPSFQQSVFTGQGIPVWQFFLPQL